MPTQQENTTMAVGVEGEPEQRDARVYRVLMAAWMVFLIGLGVIQLLGWVRF
jgi:hypothetical protein